MQTCLYCYSRKAVQSEENRMSDCTCGQARGCDSAPRVIRWLPKSTDKGRMHQLRLRGQKAGSHLELFFMVLLVLPVFGHVLLPELQHLQAAPSLDGAGQLHCNLLHLGTCLQ